MAYILVISDFHLAWKSSKILVMMGKDIFTGTIRVKIFVESTPITAVSRALLRVATVLYLSHVSEHVTAVQAVLTVLTGAIIHPITLWASMSGAELIIQLEFRNLKRWVGLWAWLLAWYLWMAQGLRAITLHARSPNHSSKAWNLWLAESDHLGRAPLIEPHSLL